MDAKLLTTFTFLLTLTLTACAVVQVPITDSWYGGFQAGRCVDIVKTLNGWRGHLTFSSDVISIEIWVATASKVTAREFLLQNLPSNTHLPAGDQFCFTFVGHVIGNAVPSSISFYIEGNDLGIPEVTTQAPGGTTIGSGGSTNKDYRDALTKSILFYYAQRSGRLPANNPIPWRGDSALEDCVLGGWYDAGDHVKFGLPMASSTTLLLWSLYAFKDGYVRAGQLDNAYDTVKWPLDYFLQAWNPTTSRLTVQVGDAETDHSYWGRPEQMQMVRPCQEVSSSSPGSDVAAETAAALAAGSVVFRDRGDTTYAAQLLSAAQSLYTFAKSFRGRFRGAEPYYTSSDDQDELCQAAVWLYRASGTSQFLNEARSFADGSYSWAYSWDDKKVACQELLFEETKANNFRNGVQSFFQHWFPGGDVAYTPCGLAWRDQWGPNRYAGNAAFLALVAAEAGTNTAQYRQWAVEQINYILGDNKFNGGCFSFEIGHGRQFPQQPHHRGASCPNLPATCTQAQLTADSPSPQVLNGALVGGPDRNDNYEDKRTDYIQNEVATDYNAGFQGALAGINHLLATGGLPQTNNKCPCTA